MNETELIARWFSQDLSDEAAAAIHLFLEQFTLDFEEHYYSQIRRYRDACRADALSTQSSRGDDDQMPLWEDDRIDF